MEKSSFLSTFMILISLHERMYVMVCHIVEALIIDVETLLAI